MKMLLRSISLAALLIAARGEKRIAGGEVVDITKFPFAAALLTTSGGSGDLQHVCGGSIISTVAILSAASCFHTDGTLNNVAWCRARVGSTLSTDGGFIHFINRITVHPEFNYMTYVNDLAIVRPTVALIWRSSVQPAPIAGTVLNLVDRQSVWAIGWGATSVTSGNSPQLRQVQFFVADQAVCLNRYSALNFTVTENMVCTGWLDVGIRAQCQGDTGSPLVIEGVVVGVNSRSEDCPDPTYPAINTRVAPYSKWIVSAAITP